MEARQVDEIPAPPGWQYEPKWDGFRCLAFRSKGEVYLQSKGLKPLARYFPDLVGPLRSLPADHFILDGELVIPVEGRLSFEQLQLRLHPAASRVARLAAEHPAVLVVFDLLASSPDRALIDLPLSERRRLLERFASGQFGTTRSIRLSPATRSVKTARSWFSRVGETLDGVMAKKIDAPYRSGERDVVLKIKRVRTADCVVGGFRWSSRGHQVGSLLLGLYGPDGLLHHVGFTSALEAEERARITPELVRRAGPPGFTGNAPGGPSRWSRGRESDQWEPVRPDLVVEVTYDQFTGGRFRHGTNLIRWRPDKAPEQCTMEQIPESGAVPLALLTRVGRAARG